MISPVLSISSKPKSSNIAIACKDGSIYEWSYMTPTKLDLLRNMKQFSATEEPTTLKYSPNGKFLVVTSNCRNVYVYNTSKKEWQSSPLMISSKKEYPHAVELSFSYDSKFFAIVDTQSCASLYRLDEEERIKSKDKPDKFEEDWVFFGKIKSHLSEINDVCFGEILNPANSSEKISKFYSIGNDKMLFQYDANNQLKNKLDVTSSYKIETESRPTACIWYPVNYLKEEIIMVATDDYKIKLWNVTKNICR
jgi:WD40 repeat protein